MHPILNRDFQHPSDGWYMIEPKGDHRNEQANVIQVIDEIASEAIVNHFNDQAADPAFPGLLIDHEHFSHDADKETRAFGWLTRLDNRPDGVYGQIRWSATGKAAVDGGDYRFFSTEYLPGEGQILNSTGPKQFRPLRLAGLTLTNKPNNKGGKPITNREDRGQKTEDGRQKTEGSTGASPVESGASPDDQPSVLSLPSSQLPLKNRMKTIATKLGLAAEASEDAVIEAVTAIMNRATAAEADVVKNKARVTELETENTALKTAQVEVDLETYKNRIPEKQREFIKGLLITNRQATLDYLKSLPEPKATAYGLIVNRATAKTPADNAATPPNVKALVDDYRIKNRCTFQAAWDAVKREKPELFQTPAE